MILGLASSHDVHRRGAGGAWSCGGVARRHPVLTSTDTGSVGAFYLVTAIKSTDRAAPLGTVPHCSSSGASICR